MLNPGLGESVILVDVFLIVASVWGLDNESSLDELEGKTECSR